MRLAMAAALMWPVSVLAQPGAGAPNVNDCTFYKDPAALRDCIDRSRIGARAGPAIGALPPNPELEETGSVGPADKPLKPEQLEAAQGVNGDSARKARRSVVIEQVGPQNRRGTSLGGR